MAAFAEWIFKAFCPRKTRKSRNAERCLAIFSVPSVDTLGHLLALKVTPANEQDRAQVAAVSAAVQ